MSNCGAQIGKMGIEHSRLGNSRVYSWLLGIWQDRIHHLDSPEGRILGHSPQHRRLVVFESWLLVAEIAVMSRKCRVDRTRLQQGYGRVADQEFHSVAIGCMTICGWICSRYSYCDPCIKTK
jgi:hypothetical protein